MPNNLSLIIRLHSGRFEEITWITIATSLISIFCTNWNEWGYMIYFYKKGETIKLNFSEIINIYCCDK